MKTKFNKPARRNGRALRRRVNATPAASSQNQQTQHPGLSREALQRIVYELIG